MNLQRLRPILTKRPDRPILNCVYYVGDEIIATDSYCMWREKQDVKVEKPFLVNLNNLKLFEGNYPDISRIQHKKNDFNEYVEVDLSKVYIKIDREYVMYYYINDVYFEFDRLNKAFGVFDLKLMHCRGYLHTCKDHLYYEKDGKFILVLGVRSDRLYF